LTAQLQPAHRRLPEERAARAPRQQERTLRRNRSLPRRGLPYADNDSGPGNLRNPTLPAARLSAALLALVLWLLGTAPAAAQQNAQAGLVIVHGDGSVTTQCVSFAEESITGADLLVRSGVDLAMEASGMGVTICRLDGEGCDYPQAPCFCQCEGTPCMYWSYWRLAGDEWTYSTQGAANTRVRAGDVDGWRWGAGTVDHAEAPPAVAFDALCPGQAEKQAAGRTEATEAVGAPTENGEGDAQQASAPVSGTASSGAAPQSDLATHPVAALAIVVGLAVALPLAALAIALLRRRSRENRA